jgi:hypothetical protein
MSQDPNQNQSVVKPVIGAVPAATDPVAVQLNQLLQLMMAKEARLAEKEFNDEQARKARNAQREVSARSHVEKTLLKQARCRHEKGGKNGPRSGVLDYNVYHHTFINGEQIIKCSTCQMKWKINDTVDFLIRGKRKIANHTKKGWQEACNMVAQSTNKASSSEVAISKPQIEHNGVEIEGGIN